MSTPRFAMGRDVYAVGSRVLLLPLGEECVLCSETLEWEAGFANFFRAIMAEGAKGS